MRHLIRSLVLVAAVSAALVSAGPARADDPSDFAITAPGMTAQKEEPAASADLSEYDNVPQGMLLSQEAAAAQTGFESKLPPLLGEIPGVYKIPGVAEQQTDDSGVLSMDQVMSAYRKGKFDVVLKNVEPMANNKQHAAEELLGVMYLQGQGVRRDPAKAFELLSQAAEAGRPLAQHYLGVMYFGGQGVAEPDTIKALMWIQIAILHYPDGPEKERAKKDRDGVYVSMTRLEKTRAVQLARDWLEAHDEGHLMDMQE